MITLYETIGWWRRSAELKMVHFGEEWNEFHHLLIMEALGGDQRWFDRFIAQHSALVYFLIMQAMWVLSPTLAYNFSELIEAHAVDTYSEFLDANEQQLRQLPPPAVAVAFYEGSHDLLHEGGAEAHESGAHDRVDVRAGPVASLYDVFSRVRDDEARHVESMEACQDPAVRARARIVELGAIATASAIIASTVTTVETVELGVETVEMEVAPLVAPLVQKVEEQLESEVRAVERQVEEVVEGVEGAVERAVEQEAHAVELGLEEALEEAAAGANKWRGK